MKHRTPPPFNPTIAAGSRAIQRASVKRLGVSGIAIDRMDSNATAAGRVKPLQPPLIFVCHIAADFTPITQIYGGRFMVNDDQCRNETVTTFGNDGLSLAAAS